MIYILQINVRKCKLGFKYTTPYNISFTESFTESCSSYLYGANALNFVSNGAVLTELFTYVRKMRNYHTVTYQSKIKFISTDGKYE